MDKPDEPGRALETRKEFAAQEQRFAMTETASTSAAAQAKAMVESRYVMAMRNPRNLDQVRQDLVAECKRPAFAHNKSAYYIKPIGEGVEGLGIRFVEVALRCMRNILAESMMVYEDADKEIHRVAVTDLETNITWPMDVKVSKTVERKKPMDDGSYISVRKNSYGKETYTVPASDDDLLNKRAALISKAMRTCGLRVIPGDFQDEAEDIIKKIRMDKAAADPGAERKAIADAFATLSVKVSELEQYLGHKLDSCSPAELVKLRGIFGAIKDGEATWKSVMESVKPDGAEPEPGKTASGRAKPDSKKKPETPPPPPPADTTTTSGGTTTTATNQPRAGDATVALVTDFHVDQIKKKLSAYEITEAELCKAFGIKEVKELKAVLVPGALAWIGDPTSKPNLSTEPPKA